MHYFLYPYLEQNKLSEYSNIAFLEMDGTSKIIGDFLQVFYNVIIQ